MRAMKDMPEFIFQSMHPIKDATTMNCLSKDNAIISIHAPYKGCNNQGECRDKLECRFQSMHPIKDAT